MISGADLAGIWLSEPPAVDGGNGTSVALGPAKLFMRQKNGSDYAGHALFDTAGVSISPSGMTAGNRYYIYLVNNAGALALVQSTSAPDASLTMRAADPNYRYVCTILATAATTFFPFIQRGRSHRYVMSAINRTGSSLEFGTSHPTSQAHVFVGAVAVPPHAREVILDLVTTHGTATTALLVGRTGDTLSPGAPASYTAYIQRHTTTDVEYFQNLRVPLAPSGGVLAFDFYYLSVTTGDDALWHVTGYEE